MDHLGVQRLCNQHCSGGDTPDSTKRRVDTCSWRNPEKSSRLEKTPGATVQLSLQRNPVMESCRWNHFFLLLPVRASTVAPKYCGSAPPNRVAGARSGRWCRANRSGRLRDARVGPSDATWFCTSTPFQCTVKYAGLTSLSPSNSRGGEDDVERLPLARLARGVHQRRRLAVDRAGDAVGVDFAVVRFDDLQFVQAQHEHAAIAPDHGVAVGLLWRGPFDVQLAVAEFSFRFGSARS